MPRELLKKVRRKHRKEKLHFIQLSQKCYNHFGTASSATCTPQPAKFVLVFCGQPTARHQTVIAFFAAPSRTLILCVERSERKAARAHELNKLASKRNFRWRSANTAQTVRRKTRQLTFPTIIKARNLPHIIQNYLKKHCPFYSFLYCDKYEISSHIRISIGNTTLVATSRIQNIHTNIPRWSVPRAPPGGVFSFSFHKHRCRVSPRVTHSQSHVTGGRVCERGCGASAVFCGAVCHMRAARAGLRGAAAALDSRGDG